MFGRQGDPIETPHLEAVPARGGRLCDLKESQQEVPGACHSPCDIQLDQPLASVRKDKCLAAHSPRVCSPQSLSWIVGRLLVSNVSVACSLACVIS
jgi:hypothetical protein